MSLLASGDLAATAVTREAMTDEGASGANLERLTFADGSILVSKEFSPERDWMMRATHDTGRAAELWVSGVMDRLPPSIDPAIVRIERHGETWRLYMTDVNRWFLRRTARLSIGDVRAFLDAAAEMHAAYWQVEAPGLCSLTDLLGLTAPATIAHETGTSTPFLGVVERGWTVFDELVPADVAVAVHRILDDPARLAAALVAGGTTLVHSDLHYGNVAPGPDRFFVLDWGLATAAPPAVDVAWYLDQSSAFVDASREAVLEAFAQAEGARPDARTLQLALLAELVLAGWQYGGGADPGLTPEARDRRRADLAWWVDRAREGLEILG